MDYKLDDIKRKIIMTVLYSLNIIFAFALPSGEGVSRMADGRGFVYYFNLFRRLRRHLPHRGRQTMRSLLCYNMFSKSTVKISITLFYHASPTMSMRISHSFDGVTSKGVFMAFAADSMAMASCFSSTPSGAHFMPVISRPVSAPKNVRPAI